MRSGLKSRAIGSDGMRCSISIDSNFPHDNNQHHVESFSEIFLDVFVTDNPPKAVQRNS